MATWKGKSKGSPLGYKFFIFIIKTFGIGFTYLLLRFVTFYYFLFASKAKHNLRLFYKQVPQLKNKRLGKIIRKNFNYLGESIVDRFAFLIGKGDKVSYTQNGEEFLQKFIETKQPLVLISAHIGNWEIAGNLLKKLGAKINVVMLDAERENLKKVIQKDVGQVHFNVIAIKEDMSHIYSIHAAIKAGEIVCIHGDRFIEGSKTLEKIFFGEPTLLPYGPFQIASRLGAHYSFIFTVKNAKYNYHFTATEPALSSSPNEVAENYVRILEEKVSEYPEQWFNYHPFFKKDARRKE
jgi:predicted LPLAT superfamily acyltransferase